MKMIQLEKEVYVGYVVAQYLDRKPEIITTSCAYESKFVALNAVRYIANKILYDVNCEIIKSGVKKITIKWQRKSLNH